MSDQTRLPCVTSHTNPATVGTLAWPSATQCPSCGSTSTLAVQVSQSSMRKMAESVSLVTRFRKKSSYSTATLLCFPRETNQFTSSFGNGPPCPDCPHLDPGRNAALNNSSSSSFEFVTSSTPRTTSSRESRLVRFPGFSILRIQLWTIGRADQIPLRTCLTLLEKSVEINLLRLPRIYPLR